MAQCFTCGESITFDRNILSKTGKQIPLWPDKQNAHGHDDFGKPTRQPLPTATIAPPPPQQQQQFRTQIQQPQQQQQQQPISQPSMQDILLSQISTKLDQLKTFLDPTLNEKLEAIYQLCKSNNDMLGAIAEEHYRLTEPKKASDLYTKMQHTKEEALDKSTAEPSAIGEVHGWNSTTTAATTTNEDNNIDNNNKQEEDNLDK
jgi:hypothetical protein